MSLKTDKVQLEIVIKGDKTRAELTKLEAHSKQLSKELKKLPKDSDEFIRKSAEYKKVQARMDQLRNQIGLTGMTMRELRNRSRELNLALNNMDPRSAKYKQLRGELDKVNARMRQLKGNSQAAGFSFKKMADGFNRYMGLFAAISASIIGVVFSMRKMIDAYDEYTTKVAELSAITGLTGDNLEWMSNKAKELSTSVTEDGIRITQSADDIVAAFTKMGSARPELLNNKEALAEVTEQAIILAEASGMDLDTAINSLATTMNQFGIASENANETINVLAAGSKYGAAQVDYISKAIVKAGPAAQSTNTSLEETVALIETLAEAGLQAEISGTGLRNFMLKTSMAADQFNPQIVGMEKALDNLAAASLSTAELTQMFGLENVTTAQILIKNRDRYAELTEQVTGTNVAMEQATITTSTHKAELEQAKNKAHLMAIELGERLAPIMTFSTNVATKFLKLIMNFPAILRENRVLFIALGAAILALNAKRITAIGLKIKELALMKTGFTQRVKEYMQYQKMLYQENLAVASKMNLAKGAGFLQKTIQKLWSVIKLNPLGALIIAAGAVLTIFMALKDSFSSVTASQKAFNEANKKAAEYAAEEQTQLRLLVFQLKNTKKGTDERKAAIDKLNQSYGQYMPNLLNENSTYKELIASLIEINKQIQQKAKLQAYEEALTQAYKDQLSVKQELDDATKREAEGTWFGNTIHNRKLSIMALNAEYEQYNQVIKDLTREVSVLQYSQKKNNATTTDSSARMGELMTIINDITKSDQERNDAIMEYNALAKAAGLETLELINTTVNLNNELEKTTSAYQKLTSEISKYEALLKDAVVKGNQAEIDSITRKLVDLNKEKDLYDGIIESLQEMIAIQASVPEQLALIDPLAGANAMPDKLEKRNEGETLMAQGEEAVQLWQDLQDLRVSILKNAESQMFNIAQSMTDAIFEYRRNKMNAHYDAELERLAQRYDQGRMSEEDYQNAVAQINERKRKAEVRLARREELYKRGFESGAIAVANIIK